MSPLASRVTYERIVGHRRLKGHMLLDGVALCDGPDLWFTSGDHERVPISEADYVANPCGHCTNKAATASQ